MHSALYVKKWERAFQRRNNLNQDTEPTTGMEWAGLGISWMLLKHEERSRGWRGGTQGRWSRKAMERIKNIILTGWEKVTLHVHMEVVVDYENGC